MEEPERILNRVWYGDIFARDTKRLPKQEKVKLAKLLSLLCENVFDPRLHTKPLGPPLVGKYSFRITRDWRVGFRFLGAHSIKLLVIDHRDTIYQRLAGLS